MTFDYDKAMEIANQLEELRIPEKTIKAIRVWANKKNTEKKGGKDDREEQLGPRRGRIYRPL